MHSLSLSNFTYGFIEFDKPPIIEFLLKLNISTSLMCSIFHLLYFRPQSFDKLGLDMYFTESN